MSTHQAAARAVSTLAFCVFLLACAKPRPTEGTIIDGSDCAHAIPVKSIKEEYQWVSIHHPGARLVRQRLSQCKDFPVDILDITLQDGTERPVYFDIQIVLQEEEKEFSGQ